MDLVERATGGGAVYIIDGRTEEDLVELLFEISTKIKLDPDVLPAWFYPERGQDRARQSDARKNQFPLFYLLVDYVHHDGPTGDFARTALLYLTEAGSKSKQLETWMIESDLAPQMASGLGALYSRLSRQAPVLSDNEKAAPIVRLCDSSQEDTASEQPEDFRANVKAFLSYLAFWQDTLNHCTSPEVTDTLLDHFQVLFVQQLLYPSLLESSDIDGGSTAAVLSHLCRLLEAIKHDQLVQRLLRYLLASSNVQSGTNAQKPRRPRMSMSRRKSMDQLKTLSDAANSPSPNLFNLLDLLKLSLRSRRLQTVVSSLKLLSVIANKHHQHVLNVMFKTCTIVRDRSRKAFNNNIIKLFDLAGAVAQTNNLDDSYKHALEDVQASLECHSCFSAVNMDAVVPDGKDKSLSICMDDKLLDAIATLLCSFFANDVVTNLALTEAIISMASCEHISLQNWLLSPVYEGSVAREPVSISFLFILTDLVELVKHWRSHFGDWDAMVAEQRHRLNSNDFEQAEALLAQGVQAQSVPSKEGTEHSSRTTVESPHSSRPSTPLAHSPIQAMVLPDATGTISSRSASTQLSTSSATLLKTRVALTPARSREQASLSLPALADRLSLTADGQQASLKEPNDCRVTTPNPQEEPRTRSSASLSHVLTNAIVLQEFILEVAAVVQIRATMFSEVDVV